MGVTGISQQAPPHQLIDVKMGAKKDGTITAAVAEMRYQGGAFPGNWACWAA